VTDAIDMLKDHGKKPPQWAGVSDGYILQPLCNKLVSACCMNNDVSQAIELIGVLFDCGYVKPGAFDVLERLVQGFLEK